MNDYKKLTHTTWECNLSFGLDSKIPEEGIVWQFKKKPW